MFAASGRCLAKRGTWQGVHGIEKLGQDVVVVKSNNRHNSRTKKGEEELEQEGEKEKEARAKHSGLDTEVAVLCTVWPAPKAQEIALAQPHQDQQQGAQILFVDISSFSLPTVPALLRAQGCDACKAETPLLSLNRVFQDAGWSIYTIHAQPQAQPSRISGTFLGPKPSGFEAIRAPIAQALAAALAGRKLVLPLRLSSEWLRVHCSSQELPPLLLSAGTSSDTTAVLITKSTKFGISYSPPQPSTAPTTRLAGLSTALAALCEIVR